MTEKKNANPAKLLIVVLVLFALAGGGIYYYFQSQTPDYSITFNDGRQLTKGAGVFLSGIEIGRVVSLTPTGSGVTVGIKIDRKNQPSLTQASRFFIEEQGEKGRLLVKNLSANAKPLEQGQVLEGTDSAFEWSTYDFAKGMSAFFESDEIRKLQKSIRSLVEDLETQLHQTDWDALGKEMEQQMEELSRSLEEALNDEQVKELQQQLKESLDEALEAIDRAQNSPEAQRLRKTIEDYLRQLQEGVSAPEAPTRKTAI